MKLAMRMTLDDLIRALGARTEALAEDRVEEARTLRRETNARKEERHEQSRT
ncbi:hypothetical protein [Oricola sp.]|uniref:hypothetical protein n=1 Tax=Oricola sp. TaxID=1979950 RepID=UPI003BA9480A